MVWEGGMVVVGLRFRVVVVVVVIVVYFDYFELEN